MKDIALLTLVAGLLAVKSSMRQHQYHIQYHMPVLVRQCKTWCIAMLRNSLPVSMQSCSLLLGTADHGFAQGWHLRCKPRHLRLRYKPRYKPRYTRLQHKTKDTKDFRRPLWWRLRGWRGNGSIATAASTTHCACAAICDSDVIKPTRGDQLGRVWTPFLELQLEQCHGGHSAFYIPGLRSSESQSWLINE